MEDTNMVASAGVGAAGRVSPVSATDNPSNSGSNPNGAGALVLHNSKGKEISRVHSMVVEKTFKIMYKIPPDRCAGTGAAEKQEPEQLEVGKFNLVTNSRQGTHCFLTLDREAVQKHSVQMEQLERICDPEGLKCKYAKTPFFLKDGNTEFFTNTKDGKFLGIKKVNVFAWNRKKTHSDPRDCRWWKDILRNGENFSKGAFTRSWLTRYTEQVQQVGEEVKVENKLMLYTLEKSEELKDVIVECDLVLVEEAPPAPRPQSNKTTNKKRASSSCTTTKMKNSSSSSSSKTKIKKTANMRHASLSSTKESSPDAEKAMATLEESGLKLKLPEQEEDLANEIQKYFAFRTGLDPKTSAEAKEKYLAVIEKCLRLNASGDDQEKENPAKLEEQDDDAEKDQEDDEASKDSSFPLGGKVADTGDHGASGRCQKRQRLN
ncbi:unnamed protein product [Amoebophrya sp. A25]|nr:unnamed protein product [Amoebophrya sp. A25]|eukprot:GSA25T00010005001.1